MKRQSIVLMTLLFCAVAGLPTGDACAQTGEEVAKIRAAMPAQPVVEPEKPRKLLVFNLCKGFVHSAIPYGAKAFEIMGEKTGAFEVVASDDPAVFSAESLRRFDGVIMNNTTGKLFEDAALKQSLLEFVRNGGGLVGVHAATDCFYDWPEYGEMMGGYFSGHPWGSGDTVGVKIDDPGHPLTAAFFGEGFQVNDEIYQFREPYSRDRLRVLLSIDTEQTNMKKGGIKRDDGDFAITWVRDYGKGRVFYCSLGHNHHIFWTPAILEHYLAGIQFAVGDLEADATPSAQLPATHLEESKAQLEAVLVDRLLAQAVRFEYGQNTGALNRLAELAVQSHGSPKCAELADRFAAALDGETTDAGRLFLCKQLWHIGAERHVPILARLLADENAAEPARCALEHIPGPAASKALLDALDTAAGAAKTGIINSLGARSEQIATPALARLALDADADTARAAASALGKIGGPDAVAALTRAKAEAPETARPAVADALLLCADGFLAGGDRKRAAALYEKMYAPDEQAQVRGAALIGLAGAQGEDALPVIVAALGGDDAGLFNAAATAARLAPGRQATRALSTALPSLTPAAQALLVDALADRRDVAALPAVMAAARHENASVRRTALGALAILGDVSSVPLLAEAAATGDKEQAAVARHSLEVLRGDGVDTAMLASLAEGPAAVRAELIGALAARNTKDAVPRLMTVAKDGDAGVRAQTFRALAVLAGAEDLSALTGLLVEERDAKVREQAEKAAVAVARKVGDEKARTAVLDKALASADDAGAKASVLAVLGALGGEAGLSPMRAAVKAKDPAVREAAVRALADWPGPEAVEDLAKVARRTKDKRLRILAVRGLVRLLQEPSDRPVERTLELYEEALNVAPAAEERRRALAGLAEVEDPRAILLVQPYLEDDNLHEEAGQALEKLKDIAFKTSASSNGRTVKNAVDGDAATRWDTGEPQKPGQWLVLDLGGKTKVTKVTLDSTGSPQDYPRGYEVYISNSNTKWGKPVAEGKGKGPVVEIAVKRKAGRYIKIVQTGKTDGMFWSIHELTVASGK